MDSAGKNVMIYSDVWHKPPNGAGGVHELDSVISVKSTTSSFCESISIKYKLHVYSFLNIVLCILESVAGWGTDK